MAENKLNYFALPFAEENQWLKLECPNCESSDYKSSNEETQQGTQTIYTCTKCQTKFRNPKK